MTVKYVTDLLKNPRRIILSPQRRASRSLGDTAWQSPVLDQEKKTTLGSAFCKWDGAQRGMLQRKDTSHSPHSLFYEVQHLLYLQHLSTPYLWSCQGPKVCVTPHSPLLIHRCPFAKNAKQITQRHHRMAAQRVKGGCQSWKGHPDSELTSATQK